MFFKLTRSCPQRVLVTPLLLIIASSVPALAATNSGIDTPSGVTSLPLTVEGIEGMTLWNSNPPSGPVNVGIGNTEPAVALDVNGAMRATSAATVKGSGCTAEGAFAYDKTNASPIYCNHSLVWSSFVASQFAAANSAVTCPGSVNLSGGGNGLPSNVTAVQVTMNVAAGGRTSSVNGAVDGLQFCYGYDSGAFFPSCDGTILLPPASHTFTVAGGNCTLVISGYFQ